MPNPPLYQGQLLDNSGILTFIEAFYKGFEIHPDVDAHAIARVVSSLNQNSPRHSLFKTVAYFMCAFSAERPARTPFPANAFGNPIVAIPNHQNAILAFELGRAALSGATIYAGGRSVRILYPIRVSLHMYTELISLLATADPQKDVFAVALIVESLCHKSNPELAFPDWSP